MPAPNHGLSDAGDTPQGERPTAIRQSSAPSHVCGGIALRDRTPALGATLPKLILKER
jgi:hypothetical protein